MEQTTNSDVKPIVPGSFLEVQDYTGQSTQVQPMELVNVVTALFAEANHPNPGTWATFMQPGSWNYTDDKVQRFAINTALRLILANCTKFNTIETRFCIVDEASITDWKRLIKSNVIPFFVKNQILF